MMPKLEDLNTFYQDNITNFIAKLSESKNRLMTVVYLRLIIFFLFIGILYFYWGNTIIILISFFILAGIFAFLVKKSVLIKYNKNYYQVLVNHNKKELKALSWEYDQFESGQKYVNPDHKFSYDIDLFGKGSFFQYINRTVTNGGSDLLAKGLSYGNIDTITDRQKSVEELSLKPEWCQKFIATGQLIQTDLSDQEALNWIKNYQPIIPEKIKPGLWIFPFLSLGLLLAASLFEIPSIVIYLWFFLGLGISGIFLKRINAIHGESSQITDTLKQYAQLLVIIENVAFESKQLKQIQSTILLNDQKTSSILKKLYKIFNSLDSRSNILISIFLNGFFLRDMFIMHQLDKWMRKHQLFTPKWFHTIYQMDELISCSNFHFNNPKNTFPTISEKDCFLQVEGLGHPLIKNNHCVRNDFETSQGIFTIITGANMAGKSTFLRSMGINISLANNGMSVCAKKMCYQPKGLISSMRTTDSLNKDESYFFSELKRLKFIVDQCQLKSHIIILDEILKGTNSKDKAEGSWKFLERMRLSGSTGIIATHDLSLCQLPTKYNTFKNQCFEAEIVDNELYFDYKLKQGQCTNMNASFLLKKMDII